MNNDIDQLRTIANEAKTSYNMGLISRGEAKELIQPYIDAVNEKSIELAKQYNVRAKKVSFAQFCR